VITALTIALTITAHGMGKSRCGRTLTPFFSEYSIAKTIEHLGRDGPAFSLILHGMSYDKIAAKYGISTKEVIDISYRGIDLMMLLKKRGL